MLASGVVTYFAGFGAMAIVWNLFDRLGGQWSQRLGDSVCVVLLSLILGVPAYVMAAISGVAMSIAYWVHLGSGVVFVLFVVSRFQNYIECFVASLMLCTLVSIAISARAAARDANRKNAETSLQSPNKARPQSGVTFSEVQRTAA